MGREMMRITMRRRMRWRKRNVSRRRRRSYGCGCGLVMVMCIVHYILLLSIGMSLLFFIITTKIITMIPKEVES